MIEKILNNKSYFVPLIFTEKQFFILEKIKNKIKLDNKEKKAYYTSIKKKLNALKLIREKHEFFITGQEYIYPERIEKAQNIIKKYSKKYSKIFISGSFLFSKEYNDIDIFIIRKKGYREVYKGKNHLVFLTESKLALPVFQSISLISVSSFPIPKKIKPNRLKLYDLMSTYHEAVIEFINKEKKPEAIRKLIFNYYLFVKNKLLNAKEVNLNVKKLKLKTLDEYIKELCSKLFSKSYLYVDIHNYIKSLEKTIQNTKLNSHLLRYKYTYEELIYGRRKSKATIS